MTFGYFRVTCLSSGVRSSVYPFGDTKITHGLVFGLHQVARDRQKKTSLNGLTIFDRVPTMWVYLQ